MGQLRAKSPLANPHENATFSSADQPRGAGCPTCADPQEVAIGDSCAQKGSITKLDSNVAASTVQNTAVN